MTTYKAQKDVAKINIYINIKKKTTKKERQIHKSDQKKMKQKIFKQKKMTITMLSTIKNGMYMYIINEHIK